MLLLLLLLLLLLNYMRITRTAAGYLINFAPFDRVESKRFVLTESGKPLIGH